MIDAGKVSGASPLLGDLVMRPHHTAVCVEDFDAAGAFLRDVVGMRMEATMDNRDEAALGVVVGHPGAVIRWAMFEHSGYRVELFRYYQPSGRTINIRQADRGITHIAFQVRDVDEVYRRIVDAGYDTYSPPQDLRGGATRPFYLRGPEGIVIEFIQLNESPDVK